MFALFITTLECPFMEMLIGLFLNELFSLLLDKRLLLIITSPSVLTLREILLHISVLEIIVMFEMSLDALLLATMEDRRNSDFL